ncbi:MAG: hypothetical protein D6790_00885, partial [Caldilineae bacterium]
MGGQVTSDLWLIDGVAATIPARALPQLAARSEIRSIVNNQSLEPAGGDGWVSDRRVLRSIVDLGDTATAPGVALPDGGFAAVTTNGKLVVLDPDGNTRLQTNLPGTGYNFEPALVGDVVVAASDRNLVGVSLADGAIRYTYSPGGGSALTSPPIVDPAQGRVYVTQDTRKVVALDGNSGALLWTYRLDADKPGQIVAPPQVATDGAVYVASSGQGSAPNGYLFALNPDGSVRWIFAAQDGDHFAYPPLVDATGVIHLVSPAGGVYAVGPDGSLRYAVHLGQSIPFNGTLMADGRLVVVTTDKAQLLDPDGAVQWQVRGSKKAGFTEPAAASSVDNLVVLVADCLLQGVDATTGSQRWKYNSNASLTAPVIDQDGYVHVGNSSGRYHVLAANGRLLSETQGFAPVSKPPRLGPKGRVFLTPGDIQTAVFGPMPNAWNGSPDVQATGDKWVYKFVNPVAVDVGADLLHQGIDTPNGEQVTGKGITIAVVDSGVYFSSEVKQLLGAQLANHFLGQADFVGDGTCPAADANSKPGKGNSKPGKGNKKPGKGNKKNQTPTTMGVQYNGYCWTDYLTSRDGYGHGSHVAGIIWD